MSIKTEQLRLNGLKHLKHSPLFQILQQKMPHQWLIQTRRHVFPLSFILPYWS